MEKKPKAAGTTMKCHEFYIENDEFCVTNDEFCVTNDEFCIKTQGTTITNHDFVH